MLPSSRGDDRSGPRLRYPLDSGTCAHPHVVRLVQGRGGPADLLSEHPCQGHGQSFEHRHRGTERLRGRCDLGPDETSADYDQPRAGADDRGEAPRVVEGTKRDDRVARLDAWKVPRMRTRSHDGLVETEPCAVVELDLVPGDVERNRLAPETQFEPELLDLAGGNERYPRFVPLAGEELLRERRAVVWLMMLVPDHHDAARVALVA